MSTSSQNPEAGQHPEPTPTPLTPERLAEYAARADRLMAKCRKRDQASLADVEGLKNDVHTLVAEVESRSFLFNSARDRAENLAADVERLTKRIAELEAAAAAGLRSLSAFIFDTTDPGADALGAQWYLQQAMPQADDPFAEPNRYRDEILREAAKRQRAFIVSDDYVSDDWEAAHDVVDLIDPDEQTAAAPEASAS